MTKFNEAVLITGCSSGIGRATALAFARLGYPVWATVRPGGEPVPELKAAGCRVLELDVTDEQSRLRAVRVVEQVHGAVSILVNNAGYGQFGPIEEVSIAKVQKQFDTNVFGMMRMCQLVLPGMRKQQRGTIVNIGSGAGCMTVPVWGVYSMSKHAVEALSDALRFEAQNFGVRVILLEPQPVRSKFFDHGAGPDIATNAYEPLKKRVAEVGRKSYAPGARNINTPEDLAAIITKAALSARPKARYRIGMQKTMYWVHALMPDRLLDRLFARQIGIK